MGKHVVGALVDSKHELALLVRNPKGIKQFKSENVKFLKGDLDRLETVKAAIEKFAPQACIHLAWEGIPDYSAAISMRNLRRSIDLIDFLAKKTECSKYIFSGTCFEYGKTKGVCKETDSTQVCSYIAWAKQAIYNYLSSSCKKSASKFIWFRLFYVYGPGQRPDSLIPSIVQAFLKGQKPQINHPLNANDFVYVEDLANAIKLAVEKDVSSGIYNLGSGECTPVFKICKMVEERLGGSNYFARPEFQKNKAKGEVYFKADIRKAKSILGWEPRTPLIKGINRYIESVKCGQAGN